MKKTFLFWLLACIIIGQSTSAQIVLENTTTSQVYLTKFSYHGYKYVDASSPTAINIYNVNHSLYRTISVPPHPGVSYYSVLYVTDKLFDLDTSFEYFMQYDYGTTGSSHVYIYNEDGSVLMYRDDAGVGGGWGTGYDPFYNIGAVYFDGAGAKLKLNTGSGGSIVETYSLPGEIPCNDCTQGVMTGIAAQPGDEVKEAKFFPNPASQYLKLKYTLPDGAKQARLKVYDITGKLVQDMEITNAFDYIYLPTDYNNGMYLYSLIVDDKLIKTEKIILYK